MKAMRFDLKMYGALVKMAMRSLMQYRADFWTSQKQVSALFLMEAVILLLGAAIVAGAVAMGLMKALFVWFFELKEMQSLSWVIFHVNFWKLLAIAAAYLCAMAAILLLTLRGLCRAPIVQLMREDAEGNRVLDENGQPVTKVVRYTVPADSVFILGDYRTQSEDSRDFGPVALTDVKAKVITLLRRRSL